MSRRVEEEKKKKRQTSFRGGEKVPLLRLEQGALDLRIHAEVDQHFKPGRRSLGQRGGMWGPASAVAFDCLSLAKPSSVEASRFEPP